MKASMHVKLGTKIYSLCNTDFKLAHMGAEKNTANILTYLTSQCAQISIVYKQIVISTRPTGLMLTCYSL